MGAHVLLNNFSITTEAPVYYPKKTIKWVTLGTRKFKQKHQQFYK